MEPWAEAARLKTNCMSSSCDKTWRCEGGRRRGRDGSRKGERERGREGERERGRVRHKEKRR
eukprot:2769510-Rhodomonas_salina.3